MPEPHDWRTVHDFWFPPGLDEADAETLRRQVEWWFGGGSNTALPPFAPLLDAAKAGRLDHWSATPLGRLSLILVLDQFPRGLFAGTPEAYACDPDALRIAEEGLRNGHHAALAKPWERMFSVMPLVHAEGPGHRERLERVVALADELAREVRAELRPVYAFSATQARGHLDVIPASAASRTATRSSGGPRPRRKRRIWREGDFVHQRRMPGS